MKITKTLKRSWPIFLFIVLIFGFVTLTETAQADQPGFDCPAPTAKQGNHCVLEEDIVLDVPLQLASGTKLDCKDHKILPTTAGQPDNPATKAFDPVFSHPRLAIFLNEAHGNTIENCIIDGGFDFGILAINSKDSEETQGNPKNKIFNNTINASYVGINLMASDRFEIKLNSVSYFVRGGTAILVHYNSDKNVIKNNMIRGDYKGAGAPIVPGPTGAFPSPSAPGGLTSNQVATIMTSAVAVTQNLGPHSTLFNVIIEGNPPKLYQLTVSNSPELNENSTADNLIAENHISFNNSTFPGPLMESGIAAPSSLRTTVLSNQVIGSSGIGIRDGQTTVRKFPGKCTLDSNRLCLTDADCFIEGIDDISKGTCTNPAPTDQDVDWSTRDFLIEDNDVEGPFNGGISIAARNATVRNNTIIGPLRQGGVGGIALRGKSALEGAVVTRNTVSNVSIALGLDRLFGVPATFFNAQISLNDFTGYTTAVKTTGYDPPNSLPSELSVDGKGNYWGLTCDEGGFDPGLVDPINPDVVDSHPYGEPVAGTVLENLPPTCF